MLATIFRGTYVKSMSFSGSNRVSEARSYGVTGRLKQQTKERWHSAAGESHIINIAGPIASHEVLLFHVFVITGDMISSRSETWRCWPPAAVKTPAAWQQGVSLKMNLRF